MKEKDLFPPLKKHFKDLGYSVYAEVPYFYRGVDFVAVKGDDHIAVEMKLSFNDTVVRQAHGNRTGFGKVYVAVPRKELLLLDNEKRESVINRISHCMNWGVGILQVVPPHNIVVEVLESKYNKPHKLFDFSMYEENENDEAGLPNQKGVSAAAYELKLIKDYVTRNPASDWREIYKNVQNHYSSYKSLAGSMSQWQGFNLGEFKKTI